MKLEDVNFASCICFCPKVVHCNVNRIDVLFTDRNLLSEGQKKQGTSSTPEDLQYILVRISALPSAVVSDIITEIKPNFRFQSELLLSLCLSFFQSFLPLYTLLHLGCVSEFGCHYFFSGHLFKISREITTKSLLNREGLK